MNYLKKGSEKKQCNDFAVLRMQGDVLSSVRRLSHCQTLVEPRSLYAGIMTLSNDDLKQAAILQYEVAKKKGHHRWIKEFRRNCQCDLTEDWIDENLPSLDGKKLTKIKKSDSEYVAGPSRDIRLMSNPDLNIIQENAAEKKREELPSTTESAIMHVAKTQTKEMEEIASLPTSTASNPAHHHKGKRKLNLNERPSRGRQSQSFETVSRTVYFRRLDEKSSKNESASIHQSLKSRQRDTSKGNNCPNTNTPASSSSEGATFRKVVSNKRT